MGGGGHPACKSPYDVAPSVGLRNFCGKCATAPMDKLKFGIFLTGVASSVFAALINHEQTYRPRWCVWNTPAGDYEGTYKSHH